MNELNKARAEKAGDSKLWTPQDCVEDLLKELKSGRIKPSQIVIHYLEDYDDGYREHGWSISGVTRQEHIALLELAKWRMLELWKA